MRKGALHVALWRNQETETECLHTFVFGRHIKMKTPSQAFFETECLHTSVFDIYHSKAFFETWKHTSVFDIYHSQAFFETECLHTSVFGKCHIKWKLILKHFYGQLLEKRFLSHRRSGEANTSTSSREPEWSCWSPKTKCGVRTTTSIYLLYRPLW